MRWPICLLFLPSTHNQASQFMISSSQVCPFITFIFCFQLLCYVVFSFHYSIDFHSMVLRLLAFLLFSCVCMTICTLIPFIFHCWCWCNFSPLSLTCVSFCLQGTKNHHDKYMIHCGIIVFFGGYVHIFFLFFVSLVWFSWIFFNEK